MIRYALALSLALAGCSDSETEEAAPPGAEVAATPSVPDVAPAPPEIDPTPAAPTVDDAEPAEPGPLAELADADLDGLVEASRELLEDLAEVLRDVTDVDSAKLARPKIEELSKRVAPLRRRRSELQAAAASPVEKLEVGQTFMAVMDTINVVAAEFGRLETLPGVRAELESSVKAITAYFESSGR